MHGQSEAVRLEVAQEFREIPHPSTKDGPPIRVAEATVVLRRVHRQRLGRLYEVQEVDVGRRRHGGSTRNQVVQQTAEGSCLIQR